MKQAKRIWVTAGICAAMFALAWFAWRLPFFEFSEEYSAEQVGSFLSLKYLKNLLPLILILLLSALGILICIGVRKRIIRKDPAFGRFFEARTGSAGKKVPGQRKLGFMTVRWAAMLAASFLMIFGGTVLSLRFAEVSLPIFSCPVNTEQMTESSCYYLAHLNDLFELPLKDILLFFGTTIGFALLLGRFICGFLCPMGLLQDVAHGIRQKAKVEGVAMTDKMYAALTPVKWMMVFLLLGLSFLGGNFCNFCPVVAVSPILAGIQTSLYFSGFFMIFVLIGSFFKRRFFCLICPLGVLLGLLHRITPFRIKKDCTACTECGACYEACPMGIRQIYTEREKTDVTDMNCILCGECVRKCPEDNALAMTFAGKKIYTASRKQVMSGYRAEGQKQDRGRGE
ncbi:MAG: 4Fe-4S binding protein [Oscillospiraceae bacterium]|nr:4Fe-4S binding protein [Oscillospiraceae bacterium]